MSENYRSLARRAIVPALCAVALGLASLPAATRAAATDGTITLRAKSADVGVGWTWGDGVLHWHGHDYPFTVKGLNVAAVGYSSVVAHGTVSNLKNLQDFNGVYAASTGEATLESGIQGKALINGNGVRIAISGATKGARLSGSADGLQLTLR